MKVDVFDVKGHNKLIINVNDHIKAIMWFDGFDGYPAPLANPTSPPYPILGPFLPLNLLAGSCGKETGDRGVNAAVIVF